jgi:Uma2 family endonuclease
MANAITTTEEFSSPTPESSEVRSYEVVGGQIVEKPAMGAFESLLASLLWRWMANHAHENQLGRVVCETLFLLDPALKLKRRPDLAFVSTQRWPLRRRVPRTETWEVVPDLAVEVVSLTNGAEQVASKIEEYFRAGVRQVWVVYPGISKVYLYDTPTSVRILQVGDDLDGGSVLPGFRLALEDLFLQGTED